MASNLLSLMVTRLTQDTLDSIFHSPSTHPSFLAQATRESTNSVARLTLPIRPPIAPLSTGTTRTIGRKGIVLPTVIRSTLDADAVADKQSIIVFRHTQRALVPLGFDREVRLTCNELALPDRCAATDVELAVILMEDGPVGNGASGLLAPRAVVYLKMTDKVDCGRRRGRGRGRWDRRGWSGCTVRDGTPGMVYQIGVTGELTSILHDTSILIGGEGLWGFGAHSFTHGAIFAFILVWIQRNDRAGAAGGGCLGGNVAAADKRCASCLAARFRAGH